MPLSETTTRFLVAAVAIPLVLAVVVAGGWPLAALLATAAILTALEFYRLIEKKGVRALSWIGAAIAALFVVLAAFDPAAGPDAAGFATLIVVSVLAIATVGIWARGVSGQPLLAISATLAGAVYAGALLSFGLFLRHLPGHAGPWHGAALVFAPVLLTWTSDTSAYFAGRAWGTTKLIPSVSPGKTVQGAIGAVVGTLVVAVGYGYLLRLFPIYRPAIWQAALFGLLVSVAAQVGDLAESLFKRDAGVKDSGRLLPGHGGALDRLDSLLFTLPLGYFFFRFLVGASGPF
jgi:phosphatidate cytidylyltransferase